MIMLERVPPHSQEAEISVLGCLLMDNGLIEKVQQTFGGKDVFYAKKHQLIYEAMAALHDKNLPIDLVNIHYRLREGGHLDIIGDNYLSSLEDSVPHSLSFDYYANEVLRLFNNRQKIEAATRIIQQAYAGTDADTSKLLPLLENSGSGASSGIVRPLDLENEVLELHKNGGLQRGVSTGWHVVDLLYTVMLGLLTVITGIPSHGKSTWLINLLVNLAMRHGWRFAIFSPENMPLKRYVAQIVGLYVGKPFNVLTQGELTYGLEWVENHFVFLDPSDNERTVDHLIGKAKHCIEKHGVNGFVIDPWNEIDHSRPDRLTETEHVSECLSKLKRLAQIHQVHVWLVAHPAKMQKRVDGTYGVPTAYDISGSAHFRNKADVCLCIWRDLLATDGVTELHIQKMRFHELGRVGMASLTFDATSGRYKA